MPRVTIPDADPDGEWVLSGFTGTQVLADGRIVVPSETSVHVFDRAGIHLRTIGRRGRGPGEFGSIFGVAWCADSTWVVADWLERRLTVLNEAGSALRTVPYPIPVLGPSLQVLGCPRQLLLLNHTIDRRPASPEPLRQDTLVLLLVDPALERFDTLASMPGGTSFRGLRMPFGAYGLAAYADGGVAYGFTGDSMILVRPAGMDTTLRVAVAGLPHGTVTAALRERHLAHAEETIPASMWERELKDIHANVPWPEQLPLWDRLLLDDQGGVWVREYLMPLDADSSHKAWHFTAPDGTAGGTLVLAASDELVVVRGREAYVARNADDGTTQLDVVEIDGLAAP